MEKAVGSEVVEPASTRMEPSPSKLPVGKDTVLAQIIRLVEEAQGSKAPIAKLADIVAGTSPIVMGIAVVAGLAWFLSGSR